ncbi:hypothetical protein [Pectobacterium versatile]|uniref:hypothetical protein n=1 Tax=Pectobacterium versatile TaxID=2488639 RepID=UPI001F1AE3E0|nr:hypothetical protein [Pectobacterium versatile]
MKKERYKEWINYISLFTIEVKKRELSLLNFDGILLKRMWRNGVSPYEAIDVILKDKDHQHQGN